MNDYNISGTDTYMYIKYYISIWCSFVCVLHTTNLPRIQYNTNKILTVVQTSLTTSLTKSMCAMCKHIWPMNATSITTCFNIMCIDNTQQNLI